MEAKELRIGNFITDEFYDSFKTVIEVDSINDRGINLQVEDDGNWAECAQTWVGCDYGFKELHGIPLTEEWILKFGFEKEWFGYAVEDCFEMGVMLDEFENGFYLTTTNGEYRAIKIKYVHKLQNLYFALTGKELELKETIGKS